MVWVAPGTVVTIMTLSVQRLVFPVLGLLFVIEFITSVELTMKVPEYVNLTEKVILRCSWELDSLDKIDSVHWYKDGQKFFQHIHNHPKPYLVFVLPGVSVLAHDEWGSTLTLAPATEQTAGRYRCEVLYQPTKSVSSSSSIKKVLDFQQIILPYEDFLEPVIVGVPTRKRYTLGDRVQLSCTSSPTWPATNLSWYLNDRHLNSPLPTIIEATEYGLKITRIRLDFTIRAKYLADDGKIVICCKASLTPDKSMVRRYYSAQRNLTIYEVNPMSNLSYLYLTSSVSPLEKSLSETVDFIAYFMESTNLNIGSRVALPWYHIVVGLFSVVFHFILIYN